MISCRRPSKSVEALLFDLDGTLLDSRAQQWESLTRALADSGVSVPESSMADRLRGVSLEDTMEILDVPAGLADTVRENIRRWTHQLSAAVRPFPEAVSLLETLGREGYRLGIVTNRPRSDLAGLERAHSVLSTVEVTVCRDDLEKGKPHPGPLLHAMRALKVAPASTIYVGDTDVDIEAGRRAACWTVLITSDGAKDPQIGTYRPHLTVSSLEQIIPHLSTIEDHQPW